ncbi:MAG: outer membrane beta-barrel protein [Bacteroidales bacterium]
MKLRLLIIILIVAMCGPLSAKSVFLNGYIIKKDGSYTYGQLKYIDRGYTVRECVFKWFDISAEYVFLPGDIEAFGFTNGMKFKTVNNRGRKLFMACLTEGDLDLLYDGSKMYLNGMGLDMVPMDNNSGSVNVEGKMVSYSGYLDLIGKLPDPDDKFTIPADITLRPEKMAVVISAYNSSRGVRAPVFAMANTSEVYEEMRNLGAYMSSYGLLAGMNASRYDAKRTSYGVSGFIPEMDFFEITPVLGLWFNRPVSRATDRITLQCELMVLKTNVYMYDEDLGYSGIVRSDINLSYAGVKMPLSIRIRFLEGSIKPFICAGGFIMSNIGAKCTREGEIENSVHVVRPFSDNSIILNKFMFGGLAGAGVKKEFSPKQSVYVELRSEYGSGIYDSDGTKQKTLSFNFVVGIDFY